nr:uncharacterized protein LOC26530359 isoform X2 [Drosophila virilis]
MTSQFHLRNLLLKILHVVYSRPKDNLSLADLNNMDSSEAARIYMLTKNVNHLLKDQPAKEQIRNYTKERELGNNSRLLNSMDLHDRCETLLQEKEVRLTEDELADLSIRGIPNNIRKELKASLGGDRSISNIIIKQIQEDCANKISQFPQLREFSEHVAKQIKH